MPPVDGDRYLAVREDEDEEEIDAVVLVVVVAARTPASRSTPETLDIAVHKHSNNTTASLVVSLQTSVLAWWHRRVDFSFRKIDCWRLTDTAHARDH